MSLFPPFFVCMAEWSGVWVLDFPKAKFKKEDDVSTAFLPDARSAHSLGVGVCSLASRRRFHVFLLPGPRDGKCGAVVLA